MQWLKGPTAIKAKLAETKLGGKVAAFFDRPLHRNVASIVLPGLVYVSVALSGSNATEILPSLTRGWAGSIAAAATFLVLRWLFVGPAVSLVVPVALKTSLLYLGWDLAQTVWNLGFDAIPGPLFGTLMTSRWPGVLTTLRDGADVAGGGGVPWWRALAHLLAASYTFLDPKYRYPEANDQFRAEWSTSTSLATALAVLGGTVAACEALLPPTGPIPLVIGCGAFYLAVKTPATLGRLVRQVRAVSLRLAGMRDRALAAKRRAAAAAGAATAGLRRRRPSAMTAAEETIAETIDLVLGGIPDTASIPSAAPLGADREAEVRAMHDAVAAVQARRPPADVGFDEDVELVPLTPDTSRPPSGDMFDSLVIGDGRSTSKREDAMTAHDAAPRRERTQDEAVHMILAQIHRVPEHQAHGLLDKILQEMALLDQVHLDDVANGSPLGQTLVDAFERFGREGGADVMIELSNAGSPDHAYATLDQDPYAEHAPVAARPAPTASDDDWTGYAPEPSPSPRPIAAAAPVAPPPRQQRARDEADDVPISDIDLVASIVPMPRDRLDAAMHHYVVINSRPLAAIGAELVRKLVACPYEGQAADDVVRHLQALAEVCNVSGNRGRLEFLFALVAAASTVSEPERDLARRKIAFVASNRYVARMDGEIDALLARVRDGQPPGVSHAVIEGYRDFAERIAQLFSNGGLEEADDSLLVHRARLVADAARPRSTSEAALDAARSRAEASDRGQTALIWSRLDDATRHDLAFFDKLSGFFSVVGDRIAQETAAYGGDNDDHPLASIRADIVAGGYEIMCSVASRAPDLRRSLGILMPQQEDPTDFVMQSTGRRDSPLFAAVCRAATAPEPPQSSTTARLAAEGRARDMEGTLADVSRRLEDLTAKSTAAEWEIGVSGPTAAVSRRVAAHLASNTEGHRVSRFPLLRDVRLGPGGCFPAFVYDWGSRHDPHRLLLLPVPGNGQVWDLDTSSRGGVALWVPALPWMRFDMTAAVSSFAGDLVTHAVDDVKLLMLDASFGTEAFELLSRRLGEADTFEARDLGAMRPNPSRGIVVGREELETGASTLSARSGFSYEIPRLCQRLAAE